jgi:hypothetical protein
METLARRPYKAAPFEGSSPFPHNPTTLDVGFYSPEAWTSLKSSVSLPYSQSSKFILELPLTLLGPDPPINSPTTTWVSPLRICAGLTPWQIDLIVVVSYLLQIHRSSARTEDCRSVMISDSTVKEEAASKRAMLSRDDSFSCCRIRLVCHLGRSGNKKTIG